MLLQRLSLIRERAEAAHLEVVLARRTIAWLEKQGRDTTDARLELNKWRMSEQKLLRELDWVLDKLDHLDRVRNNVAV